MTKLVKTYWPLLVAVAALWLASAICLDQSLNGTRGQLVYALDDAYIHMAMAKNISQHGVFGVTRYAFSASSSSPLWLSLLSLFYFIFGPNNVTPFVLNLVFATAICVTAYLFLKKSTPPKLYILIVLLSITLLTPLVTLVFVGTEHTLHALVTVAFAFLAARALAKREVTRANYLPVVALSPFLTSARYEGVFLNLVVAALFIFKRRPFVGFLIAAAGMSPLAVYGLASVSKGWYFLPVPILLKADVPRFTSRGVLSLFEPSGLENIANTNYVLVLVLASLAAFILAIKKRQGIWHEAALMPMIFAATAFLHLQYAQTGAFYRYESYLITLGLFAVGASLAAAWPERIRLKLDKTSTSYLSAAAAVLILGGMPLFLRAKAAFRETPRATANIFEQQIQMGLFAEEFYEGKMVAVNDVGAINYLADIKCLDLYGLATLEVAKAKRRGYYDTAEIGRLAATKGAVIAVVYKKWFDNYGGLPSNWSLVGKWKISGNVVCGSPVVHFYAVEPDEQFTLFHNLVKFSERLPETVEVSGPIAGPAARSYPARGQTRGK